MKTVAFVIVIACVPVVFAQAPDYVNYNSGQPTGAEFLTHFGAEGGPTALLYNDRPTGHGGIFAAGMELALERLGYSVTFTNQSAIFASMIGPPETWDMVVSGHHNLGFSSHDAAISAYVTGGSRAIVEDWRRGFRGPAYTFGFVTSPSNYTSVKPVAGSSLAEALGTNPIPLYNSGWSTFSITVVSPGGVPALTSNVGSTAGLTRSFAGSDNNLFFSGLNDDAIGPGLWDPALAQDLYSAMILSTPEPATALLLFLSAPVIMRRRR